MAFLPSGGGPRPCGVVVPGHGADGLALVWAGGDVERFGGDDEAREGLYATFAGSCVDADGDGVDVCWAVVGFGACTQGLAFRRGVSRWSDSGSDGLGSHGSDRIHGGYRGRCRAAWVSPSQSLVHSSRGSGGIRPGRWQDPRVARK